MKNKVMTPQIPPLDFHTKEAINILRGNIQMAGYNVKVIAFTSARAHEGKSSLSFRLAKSLAGLHKKVLYLDCDIRNSKTKKRYHIVEKTEGLSEYLCGQWSPEEIIYPTDDPYFDIIFSGKYAPNPSELISGELFSTLIETLREQYDYVILDTPPANLVIDGVLAAKCCDATILVGESGFTDRRDAMHLKNLLENAGIKIMGVVLNKMVLSKKYYGYGKYGYRKYGYKKYDYGYEEYLKEAEENRKEVDG